MFASIFGKAKEKKTPIKGIGTRFGNIFKYHRKGLIGSIVPLVVVISLFEKNNNIRKVQLMWFWMFWFFLIRPVNTPVTAFIPIFFLPMTGVLESGKVCALYMNDNVQYLFLGGMILLFLNNSGVDRRLALVIINAGNKKTQFSAQRLVYKCTIAAYLLSMFSNRLIVTAIITEYAFQVLSNAESKFGPDMKKLRLVVCNAIQVAACIGSLGFVHASYTIIALRSILDECAGGGLYPDVFNYLQYSAFAIPVSLAMYVGTLVYHMVLVQQVMGKKPMTQACTDFLSKQFSDRKSQIPKDLSRHEKFSIVFLVITFILLFTRWNQFFGGWAIMFKDKFSTDLLIIPRARDTVVAALMAILAHSLPYNFHFLKYFSATKKKDLPPAKPESTVLWFKFVDKNINYSYFFVIGAGNCIMAAGIVTRLDDYYSSVHREMMTWHKWNFEIFVVVLVGIVFCNLMPALASCIMILPLLICGGRLAEPPWPVRFHLAALGLAMATNLSFSIPYNYTPAFFCHYVGKVPVMKMVKYSFMALIICLIILWLALCFYAPLLWQDIIVVGGGGGGGGGGVDGGGGPGNEPTQGPPPTDPPRI